MITNQGERVPISDSSESAHDDVRLETDGHGPRSKTRKAEVTIVRCCLRLLLFPFEQCGVLPCGVGLVRKVHDDPSWQDKSSYTNDTKHHRHLLSGAAARRYTIYVEAGVGTCLEQASITEIFSSSPRRSPRASPSPSLAGKTTCNDIPGL